MARQPWAAAPSSHVSSSGQEPVLQRPGGDSQGVPKAFIDLFIQST